jgi:hypothetical protein
MMRAMKKMQKMQRIQMLKMLPEKNQVMMQKKTTSSENPEKKPQMMKLLHSQHQNSHDARYRHSGSPTSLQSCSGL